MSKSHRFTLDVEIYDGKIEDDWPQARFIVHTHDDVYWVNSPTAAAVMLRDALLDIVKKYNLPRIGDLE